MTTPAKSFDKPARRPATARGGSAARLLLLSSVWALPAAAHAQEPAATQGIPASQAAQAGTSSEATGDVSATARAGTTNAGADNRSGYGDIVVTAQRVKQTLQSVPLSLQVLGTKQLEDLQVQSFQDYVRYLPSVSSNGGNQGFNATVVVRGIVTDQGNVASGSLPTVGQYIDEQPITTIDGAPDLHIYDIARVEQLSGPQGTLFGASSMGGVLRVITNKPDPTKFAGGIDLEANKFSHGSFGGVGEGFINLPLTDRIALRVVGWYDREGGYVDNILASRTYPTTGVTDTNAPYVKNNYNYSDTYGGRAALAAQLSDSWTVTPSVIYQNSKRNGTSAYIPQEGDLKTEVYTPEDGHDHWYQAALTVQGKIGNFDLTYAGSYFDRRTKQNINYADYDYYYDQIYGGIAGTVVNNAGNVITPREVLINREHFTKHSEEIRLASPTEDPVRFIVGAFYQRQVQGIDLNYFIPGYADSLSVSTSPGTVFLTREQRIDRDYALFTQADIDILPKLTVTGGIRLYRYDNSLFGFFGTRANEAGCIGAAVVSGSPCTNIATLDSSGKPIPRRVTGNGHTYRLALTYKFDSDHMLYASVADGFRPGGTNRLGERGQQVLGSQTVPYEPDSLTNYEIGTKNLFWGRRARLNVTLFDQEWRNIQLGLAIQGVNFIQNVAKARSRGVEVSAGVEPVHGLTFNLNGAYIDGTLRADYIFNGTVRAPSGSRLPYSPRLKANAILRYEWDAGEYKPYVQVAESYQTNTIGGFTAFDRGFFGSYPSYGISDISLGVSKDQIKLDAYVTNLFDKRAVTYRSYVYYVPQSGYFQYAVNPRRAGIRASYRF